MRKEVLNIEEEHAADESAAEFLRAREAKVPGSLEELRQASESASAAVERIFGNLDRLRAMKETEPEEEREDLGSSSYDAWIHAALDLDEAFLDEGDGALGRQLIELVSLDDAAFVGRKDEARRLLQHTSNVALRVYPSIHRLVTLGFGTSRFEVAEKLSVGDLVQQERVQSVAVTPRRKTIIGLLRDLDARLPENERTNVWSLEVSPELPPVLVVSDPFQSENEALTEYWVKHVGVARKERDVQAGMLSLSGERTSTIISDLQDIAEHATDDVLQNAARLVATWLEGKQIYYTDPDPRHFELYHLGMEDPATLMEVMRSLDVIKHFDPEFFFELMGIDPSLGGRSPSFGSFLHKAIYNTQRAVDHAAPELGEMAIRTMMNQLLTLDDQVQTYSAVVSQESLKAMAGEMQKSVDASETSQSKAQTLMMMAVPYSRMAVAAEVRRQLDAMREASSENIVEELRRRIDDIEHPLKLADYLANLPKMYVRNNVEVRRELRKVMTDAEIEDGAMLALEPLVEGARSNLLLRLYARIPLIDESRDDLGFAMRIRVAIRDAVALANYGEEWITDIPSKDTRARQFLSSIIPQFLYREELEAVGGGMGLLDRQVANRLVYLRRSGALDKKFDEKYVVSLVDHVITIPDPSAEPSMSAERKPMKPEDSAFFIGQMIVGWDKDIQPGLLHKLFSSAEASRPDLIFLSVIAHPKGKEIAFKYFDKFCDMIPAERMSEISRKQYALAVRDFFNMFWRPGNAECATYISYLHKILFRGFTSSVRSDQIPFLIQLNRVLVEGKTPWTKDVELRTPTNDYGAQRMAIRKIDAWEIWEALGKKGMNPEQLDRDHPDMWKGIGVAHEDIPALAEDIARYFMLGELVTSSETEKIKKYLREKI